MTTGIIGLLATVAGIVFWYLRRKRGRIDPKVKVAKKVVAKARANVSAMKEHLAKGDTDALEEDIARQSDRLNALRGVLREDDSQD